MPAARQVLVDAKPAKRGARAFDILVTLIERRDRVVDKDELLAVIWPGVVVEEWNLHVHVSTLRKVLGPGCISTVAAGFTGGEAQPLNCLTGKHGSYSSPAHQATAVGQKPSY